MNTINTSVNASPVAQQDRIIIIDSLRGIALMGILLMNIPYFGLPDPAADNLLLRNEMGTLNEKVWYFINFFLEGSQRAIFSMLFGAGVILFITRLEKRVDGMMTAEYFMRRQLWLLLFGLANAFILLWSGDILFEYAICGMIIFVFRRLSPNKLIIAAFVCLLLMTARGNLNLFRHKMIISKGETIAKIDTLKTKLTEQQKDDLGAYTGMKEKDSIPGQIKEMEKNTRQIRGTYAEVYKNISKTSTDGEFWYTYFGLWDVLVFMFLGMAFFKLGILTGNAPAKTYWLLSIIGLGVGMLISYYRIAPILHYKFSSFNITKNIPFDTYEISRTFRSLGIFGLIMLMYKSGWFKWLFALARPVGQMAFTNYLMQSLMCAIFFYGFGFGMYGQLQRYEIYYVVGVIWIIELCWSHLWLYYFRFGPLEWLWRSLTYWKKQGLVKKGAEK